MSRGAGAVAFAAHGDGIARLLELSRYLLKHVQRNRVRERCTKPGAVCRSISEHHSYDPTGIRARASVQPPRPDIQRTHLGLTGYSSANHLQSDPRDFQSRPAWIPCPTVELSPPEADPEESPSNRKSAVLKSNYKRWCRDLTCVGKSAGACGPACALDRNLLAARPLPADPTRGWPSYGKSTAQSAARFRTSGGWCANCVSFSALPDGASKASARTLERDNRTDT